MSSPDSPSSSDGQQPSPKRSWFTRYRPSPTLANTPTDASTTTPADPPTDPRRHTPAGIPAPDSPSPSDGQQPTPPHPDSKTYATFNHTQRPPPTTPPTDGPPPPANREFQSRPSITDAVASIKPDDLLSVHQTPCAQSGFLTGISAGMGVGGLRWVMGLPLPRAANWAVGVGVAAAAAQYEYCQMRRRIERANMVRMVKVYTAKKVEERAERKSAGEEAGETKKRGMNSKPVDRAEREKYMEKMRGWSRGKDGWQYGPHANSKNGDVSGKGWCKREGGVWVYEDDTKSKNGDVDVSDK